MTSNDFATDGYAIAGGLLSVDEVAALQRACDRVTVEGRAGARGLLSILPEVQEVARHRSVSALVERLIGPDPFAVRAVLFDKTPETNWQIRWHQDATIAVSKKRDVPGFYGWSQKHGVPHVHPPAEVLDGMVAVRLHLDDCGEDNGPLSVFPGSHRKGRLTDEDVGEWRAAHTPQMCTVKAGDGIVMRPLLLHHSRAALNPKRRRVIHLEFARHALPPGLDWYERVA